MPPDLLARYFEQVNGRYVFRKDLRRAVIFGRNDLVKDAAISWVDLLVCRNSLMYLNAETQRNVLGRLHFDLAPQGTLFLGQPGLRRALGAASRQSDGLRAYHLDIGLPLDSVRPLIGNAFVDPESSGQVVADAVNRRGRPATVRITCTSFRSSEGDDGRANRATQSMPAPGP
nr:CheR family methyltransferase [Mycobacterium colombiense]